ncbi:MAG TPA: prepilin-type N-terminal cleavage/methylation domain-containing protein [Gemmatimonadaceae bacterium]|nr:prepilin-type N-terminal cleavage/methylation domain-containing protein [Gemmatimonadaceae bacterium]
MRHIDHRRVRRGFTLIELLVGIVLFGIVGVLFTKLLTTQGRFFDRQGMGNAARNVSRASLNRVVSDFRMIEAGGGVLAASSTSLTIRIPYAIGVMCANSNGASVLSLLPVDSTMYNNAVFFGYAWRNWANGAYGYVQGAGTSVAPGDAAALAACTGVNVTTVRFGRVVSVTPVLPNLTGLGTPVFLYSQVRYQFRASTAVPGTIGLYRAEIAPNGAVTEEELVAPFANTASWKFFTVGGGAVAQVNPPADLSTIRGLELHLDGLSEGTARTKMTPELSNLTTAVFFKNRTT